MHLVFLSSLWVLGLLVAIPLLAHLFSKTRPLRRQFPSLLLLREALRQVTRIRRPHDRWLLLLRSLAMLALVLGFLQPWLFSQFTSGQGIPKTVILLVDSSASMAYPDGTRTRLAQATAAAEEILAALPPNSQANIIWVQAQPASVLLEPGPNLEFLRQALRSATVRSESGDLEAALALARRQLLNAKGERELIVLSDFQKSAWPAQAMTIPEGVQLTRVRVGSEEAANLSVSALALEPRYPMIAQITRLSCLVDNHSAVLRRVTLFVEAGESRFSQQIEILPWSRTPALFELKFPSQGLVPLKASITEDRYPGDDVLYGLAEVRGALEVNVAGAAENMTANVWTRAAQALDGLHVQRFGIEQLGAAAQADILMIAGWNGQAAEALQEQLNRGGTVIIQPSDGLDPTMVRPLLGLDLESALPLVAQAKELPGWQLRVGLEEHPVFALFAGGAFGDPAAARFSRRWLFPTALHGEPLLVYEDGVPALATLGKSPSNLLWWNLDLNASDWASRSVFLPFFGELLKSFDARAHRSSQNPQTSSREIKSGEPLALKIRPGFDPSTVQLLDGQDRAVAVRAEAGRVIAEASTPPGNYRWLARETVLDQAVVNFPEQESDLRQLSEAELKASAGLVISDPNRLEGLREGKPLWPWCLASAALLLLLEGVYLWLLARKPNASQLTKELKVL